MSWQKYTPTIAARPDVPVSISISESAASRAAPFLLIDSATIKALGWKAGSRIMLSIGEDEHDGKLRLEPAEGEVLELRAPSPKGRTRRHRITLGRLPCLADDRVRSACRFEAVKSPGGGATALVVTLPDAARAHRLPRGTAAAVAAASGRSVK